MLRFLHQTRMALAAALSLVTFAYLWKCYPFPSPVENALLASLCYRAPSVYRSLQWAWLAILFGVPFLYVYYPLLANLRRISGSKRLPLLGKLPPYPDPRTRESLQVILGELHHPDKYQPSLTPTWLTIPEEGLNLGLLAMGMPGTGKSAGLILPATAQLLSYRAADKERRVGGLVLEVKGDFCKEVRGVLEANGRGEDYLEVGPDSPYCYNPLHNDASPTALAFNLIALMKMLRGESKEPFWEQAAEALISFLILVYRLLRGYVTLFDIYQTASDLDMLDVLMKQAAQALEATNILIDKNLYMRLTDEQIAVLDQWPWSPAPPEHMRFVAVPALHEFLQAEGIEHQVEVSANASDHARRREQFQSAERYNKKLKRLDERLKTLVAEGINVFLMVTDFDPTMRRIFCPPKEAYDPVLNADHRYGRPLPALDTLIETSAIVALNMPMAADENMARIAGTLLKQDWQRAVLNRIPRMQEHPQRIYRPLAMLIDEYHLLATVGGSLPMGDEKFLNLCRAARCIPIVAFQTLSSLKDTVPAETWRTIFAAFATTIVLRQKDFFTAELVSKMCGRVDMFKEHYGFTEGGHDAIVSAITGRTTASRSSINMSHSYNLVRELLREPKDILELPRGVAIVLANTGDEQLPPTYCYLTPYGQDPSVSYWSQFGRMARVKGGHR